MGKIIRENTNGKTYAFIDASNLFYGGRKSLGWSIDYQKLAKYLKRKYAVSKIFYFGGVDLYGYNYDYLQNDSIPLAEVSLYLRKRLKDRNILIGQKENFEKSLSRISFYQKLDGFGYRLFLKPVKIYRHNRRIEKKANCDVEMAFQLMKEIENYKKVLFLSGDGDFLPILKYLRKVGKDVLVLARGERTAREIRQFAGAGFRDFVRLEREVKFDG